MHFKEVDSGKNKKILSTLSITYVRVIKNDIISTCYGYTLSTCECFLSFVVFSFFKKRDTFSILREPTHGFDFPESDSAGNSKEDHLRAISL